MNQDDEKPKKENKSDLKYRNIKYYCKKYGISVKKKGTKGVVEDGEVVSKSDWYPVGVLAKKIYDYEVSHNIKNGFYPFLTGK
jgi:hypothetical protein